MFRPYGSPRHALPRLACVPRLPEGKGHIPFCSLDRGLLVGDERLAYTCRQTARAESGPPLPRVPDGLRDNIFDSVSHTLNSVSISTFTREIPPVNRSLCREGSGVSHPSSFRTADGFRCPPGPVDDLNETRCLVFYV